MKHIIIWIITLLSLPCFAETGARTWEINADGIHFSLKQIFPIQVQAFYVGRGFTLEQIEPYSSSCVFMTVLRNDSAPGTIHFISNDWPILVDGNSHQMVSVDEWVKRWTIAGIKKSAIVAFRWAQFPPEQEYEPGGDWNQGMLSIGLPPASQFDVIVSWDINGKGYQSKLEGVNCAK